jgi:hypothetical protein
MQNVLGFTLEGISFDGEHIATNYHNKQKDFNTHFTQLIGEGARSLTCDYWEYLMCVTIHTTNGDIRVYVDYMG